ncbi:MAG: RsmB/NOP family class I SAM-dependent RNA methyltransferase [Erythrobacter sp.]
MRPGPRVQAAIELLDAIIDAAKSKGAPADRLISEYFRQRRYAGSKDRRAVRELVYGAIRVCGPIPKSGRAAMLKLAEVDPTLAELFDGTEHAPPAIGSRETAAEGGVAPEWLMERLAASGIDHDQAAALLERAPLDLRVNTIKADRAELELPIEGEHLAAAQAIRLPSGTSVEQWEQWREGQIEVQDHGSQLVCSTFGATPGETIVDLCAGAGGKSLALAAAMQNSGQLLASDIDRGRLSKLEPRARRAGAGMVQTMLLDPGKELDMLADWHGKADGVLVDAPCSGTGTWRRNPESRWRLDAAELAKLSDKQDSLLDMATTLVKPGGRIGFVTCSLLDEEGAARVDAFLARYSGWTAEQPALPVGTKHGQGLRLTPSHDGTDGFFVAILRSA